MASVFRVGVPAGVVVAAVLAMPATAATPIPLQQRPDAARSRESQLRGGVGHDNAQIQGFQGRIDDLRTRLVSLESSLAVERELLEASKSELRVARGRLLQLKLRYAHARRVLAAQLVADYKADRPDIVTVILDADGFADLLERADALRAVARRNSRYTADVRDMRAAVGRQAVQLKAVTGRRQEIARATFLQTQEVAELRNGLVNRQLQFIRARDSKTAKLSTVHARRRQIEQRLDTIAARAARAAVGSLPAGLGARAPPPDRAAPRPDRGRRGARGGRLAPGGPGRRRLWFLPGGRDELHGWQRAADRRAARPPRQSAAAAPHRAVGLPHAAALGRGRRLRRRPAHPRRGVRHAGRRGRPRGDAAALRPDAPVRRRARDQPHSAGVGPGLFELVVAVEDVAAGEERRDAAHAELPRALGRLAQARLD